MLTDEQRIMRLGSVGGSGITKAVANGDTRTYYLYRKASEIITGVPAPSKSFEYADRGNEFESVALNHFAYVYGVELTFPDIVKLDDHKHYTPDGVIGPNSFVECKVRLPHVFLQNKDTGAIETSTRRQMQWGFRVMTDPTDAICYYIQYCPEMPNPMFVQEIKPDPKEIDSLDSKCDLFISEMIELVERHQ